MPKTPPWKLHGGYWIVLAIVVSALALVFSIGYANSVRDQRAHALAAEAHSRCLSINRLQGAVLAILVASQKALPANKYYRLHPGELRAAERATRRDVGLVRRARCVQTPPAR